MRFRRIRKTEHGGRTHLVSGSTDAVILDFSENLNPFPPSFSWNPDGILVSSYPDNRYADLKEHIARIEGRSPDEICVGNGSVEIIRSFCLASLKPGDSVCIPPHTFGEYAVSVECAGGIPVNRQDGCVAEFFCNPNNPTGILVQKSIVLEKIHAHEEAGTQLFIDEAFIDLADPAESVTGVRSEHAFVLRSLTKAFSVPGIRFGWGVGCPELVTAIEAIRPPWSVNAYAESYAHAALDNADQLTASRERITAERSFLADELQSRDLSVCPSAVNFLLFRSPVPASDLKKQLLSRGILIRDCASFGLPEYVRIAVRTRDENTLLLEALDTCLP
ncbi:histidinol-phosphate aminotransferase family protein [Methanogenium sp. S4BF]|uniref:pyridoxal phosphate-dependent aminotransferase n=1 Tax=Methanogenium sp. S4BF TaxID=1789226 RepID=UPI00241812A2|nr:histidinol-phosphate transaminase [Methanogenium sp. S4BF]WFN35052.1 histidinol-phosphate aminotransferase family protein [Methanogenium sp. S4BF]